MGKSSEQHGREIMPHVLRGARHVPLRPGPLLSSILGQSSSFKPAVPLLLHAVLIWPWQAPKFALSTIIWAGFHRTNWFGAPSSCSRRAFPAPGSPTFSLSQGRPWGLNTHLIAPTWSILCGCCLHNRRCSGLSGEQPQGGEPSDSRARGQRTVTPAGGPKAPRTP